ncbi:MAG: energy transducer TonB [Caulobacterales bacterium]|uniref:energy transducer TonB n=1 Tax=Glycocaulis sp. TaxID=1969725 RepID=UPI003FA0E194
MASIVRLLVSMPLAAIITFLLFTLMQILIFEDGVPLDDAGEELRISISEAPEEIQARVRDANIDQVEDVTPPPPPPAIERARADQPTESLSTIVGGLPEFDRPSLTGGDISFNVSDRDAQPLVRIPPQYPPRAAERGLEGRCSVEFDVTPDGNPTNVRILSCSNSVFERESIRAVERWRYEPRVQDGTPQWRRGVQTQFDYNLDQ